MPDLLFLGLIFLSNLVQTITGFAGTVLVMPFAILLKGPGYAMALLNLVGLAMVGYVAARNRRHINRRQLGIISPVILLGIVMGLWLYSRIQPEWILRVYAVFILLITVLSAATGSRVRLGLTASVAVILLAGVAHGMFVSGGPLLILYALGQMPDKQEFRSTICAVWVITNLFLVWQHNRAGYYTAELFGGLLFALPAMAAGVFVGNKIYARVSQKVFLRLSYALLVLVAVYILV